jgi:hypothetical protein
MQMWADGELERLKQIYGESWDIWYVARYPVGYTWNAKPKGAQIATIHANTVEDLEAQIKLQEGGERANGLGLAR